MGIVRHVARGAVAGAVGTLAMDLLWYRRYRAGGGTAAFPSWELSTTATDFGPEAPAPARVGHRLARAVGVELPPSAVAATNDVVHWMTGLGWGKVAGLASAVVPGPSLAVGIGTGVAAWGTSYAVLPGLGIYRPITAYDADTLWKDLSAHLVFGTVVGVVLGLGRLSGRGGRR